MRRGVVALGLVPLMALAGCGESAAHKDARETAKLDAEAYCAIVRGYDSYSDEYARCVKDQAHRELEKWESEHPGK